MDSIIIRNMEWEDVPAVVRLETEIFSSPWSEESFLEALKSQDNVYLVAVSGEKIVGYCGFWISFDTADLCNMAVDEEYRRRFAGQRLLEEGMCRLKKRCVKHILLEVRKSNTGAERLYRKLGFSQIGTRKGYYSKPTEDALVMERAL